MKTKKIKWGLIGLMLFLGVAICTIVSCDDNETTSQNYMSEQLKSDMRTLYQNNKKLIRKILKDSCSANENTSDSIKEVAQSNLKPFITKYRTLIFPKTRSNSEKPLSQDSIEIMALNPSLLLSYIQPRVSTRYYNIIKNAIESSKMDLTEDDIISDNELAVNEKLSLLLIQPLYEENFTFKLLKTRAEEHFVPSVQECKREYNISRLFCGAKFVGKGVLTIIGGIATDDPVIPILGILGASSDLNTCLNLAEREYLDCLSKVKDKN
jgi:hypothetical protein